MNVMTKSGIVAYHPLDQLSADEVTTAAGVVRGADIFNAATKFETIELHYPDRAAVQGWEEVFKWYEKHLSTAETVRAREAAGVAGN